MKGIARSVRTLNSRSSSVAKTNAALFNGVRHLTTKINSNVQVKSSNNLKVNSNVVIPRKFLIL